MAEIYGFSGTFEEYVDLFMKGDLVYGNYWDHLKVSCGPLYTLFWFNKSQTHIGRSGLST